MSAVLVSWIPDPHVCELVPFIDDRSRVLVRNGDGDEVCVWRDDGDQMWIRESATRTTAAARVMDLCHVGRDVFFYRPFRLFTPSDDSRRRQCFVAEGVQSIAQTREPALLLSEGDAHQNWEPRAVRPFLFVLAGRTEATVFAVDPEALVLSALRVVSLGVWSVFATHVYVLTPHEFLISQDGEAASNRSALVRETPDGEWQVARTFAGDFCEMVDENCFACTGHHNGERRDLVGWRHVWARAHADLPFEERRVPFAREAVADRWLCREFGFVVWPSEASRTLSVIDPASDVVTHKLSAISIKGAIHNSVALPGRLIMDGYTEEGRRTKGASSCGLAVIQPMPRPDSLRDRALLQVADPIEGAFPYAWTSDAKELRSKATGSIVPVPDPLMLDLRRMRSKLVRGAPVNVLRTPESYQPPRPRKKTKRSSTARTG